MKVTKVLEKETMLNTFQNAISVDTSTILVESKWT